MTVSDETHHDSKYAKKVASGRMMYGPKKHPAPFPYHPTASETIRKFGDASKKITIIRDGKEVRVHRSQT